MAAPADLQPPIYEARDAFAPPDSDPDTKSIASATTPTVKPKTAVAFNKGWPEFRRTVKVWASETFTKRFWLAALAGQFVSVCIVSTNVETTELVRRNWSASTTQTFFLYLILFAVYTPVTIYRYGAKAWAKMVLVDGWKYFILAAVDVEGNYSVIKAYQYSDLLSCELLDAWATPVCMLVAWILVKARYHWTQYLGVLICVAGMGLLVVSDFHTDKNYPAQNKPLGDGLMIVGATLYGISNGLQEYLVRQRPVYEVVGMLGFWGTIINGVQAVALEHNKWNEISWNGGTIGMLVAYTASMLALYTVVPILFRLASSPFYNISILTSDFWGLIFGLGLYGYEPYWLYFIAYALTLIGLAVYFCWSKPEEQGVTNVVARGKQGRREDAVRQAGGRVRVIAQN